MITNLPLDQSKYGFIYLTTNLVNGKQYIGKRKIKGDEKDFTYLGSGKILRKAIEKEGKENFTRQILVHCENEEKLKELETFLIEEANVLWPVGYNIAKHSDGGAYLQNHPNREEIVKKISKSLKGFVFTEKRNKKISESHKGVRRPVSVIEKIKETKRLKPYKHTEEDKIKGVLKRKQNGSYVSNRKGKTYIEIYGLEKALKMKKRNTQNIK